MGRGEVRVERRSETLGRVLKLPVGKRDRLPGRLRDGLDQSPGRLLDPGIVWHAKTHRNSNATPLLVNTAGSWQNRPDVTTKVPNLLLAGDFVRTNIDLATMEGANESARRAVNALLDADRSDAGRCRVWELYRPPELEPLKRVDEVRYRLGLPNTFDVG